MRGVQVATSSRWSAWWSVIAVLCVACGAPPYTFDASIRTDAHCDFCDDGGVCLDLATDPLNCGACGRTCLTAPNARATCTRGTCGVECSGTFADCNVDPADGCETDLSSSALHCGSCMHPCTPRTGLGLAPTCVAAQCRDACDSTHGDCNSDLQSDGCESDLQSSSTNCGGCGVPCAAPANGSATCTEGACSRMCNPNYFDCDGDPSSLCETNVATSDSHCGACGNRCGTGTHCVSGACHV